MVRLRVVFLAGVAHEAQYLDVRAVSLGGCQCRVCNPGVVGEADGMEDAVCRAISEHLARHAQLHDILIF